MIEYLPTPSATPQGFRLHRLEVLNWGTFDSSDGQVHIIEPRGETTLLVGRNGSGKSTLVDSLLTLLVPNQIRNYNVAAGAGKRERDEKSYIRGACGRLSRETDGEGPRVTDVKYLRPKPGGLSALLAVFKNEASGASFTVAQVLHIDGDGGVPKHFCFRAGETSIEAAVHGLTSTERLRQQLERKGWALVTPKFAEYRARLQKVLHCKDKAFDIFNKTVAVKDIESLNGFIRLHMLEQKPWRQRVDALLQHFTQLSEAHSQLVAVRKQFQLLEPVKKHGILYREMELRHQAIRQRYEAMEAFFRTETMRLFAPALADKQEALRISKTRHADLKQALDELNEKIRQLLNDIEKAGGERLREIPRQIQTERAQADAKRRQHERYAEALKRAEMVSDVASHEEFEEHRQKLDTVLRSLLDEIETGDAEITTLAVQQDKNRTQLTADSAELDALNRRRTNLPESHVHLRQRLCEDLRLPVSDLPFAAELMAVKREERAWEASIELALRGFGLSLLVPAHLYQQVSSYVDRTALRSADGRGQRLVYLHVREEKRSGAVASHHQDSLTRKLDFKEGNRLLPWLKSELAERYNFQCCSTIEEFREASGLAMTKERHFRRGSIHHEKDDRETATSRREFILGWDNKEKKQELTDAIRSLEQQIANRDRAILAKRRALENSRNRQQAAEEARRFNSFAELDYTPHENRIAELEEERRLLEQNNDTVQKLKSQLIAAQEQWKSTDGEKDDVFKKINEITLEIEGAEKLIARAKRTLSDLETEGRLSSQKLVFPELEEELGVALTVENLFDREDALKKQLGEAIGSQETEIRPLRDTLTEAMAAFTRAFKEVESDLRPTPSYLDSFLGLRDSIEREGLPQQEARFKERLNEKVSHEIGLLNGSLNTEQGEITGKIDLLNKSLQELPYRRGTLIRLEASPVRDAEVIDFRRQITECLAGQFEGSLEADEARYLRIAKLIERLRDEPRWTEKVTDVRRWFDFTARELEVDTGNERDSYSDSGGKSGGEKAKLAFTILVAAIAYQYDIDPQQPVSDRFHFVVVDEMFSKVDDQYSEYALDLFKKFGLQLLIVAPLDAKARITEPYVGCYLHVLKDDQTNRSEVFSMTAEEFQDQVSTST